jgi:hypothetical protein
MDIEIQRGERIDLFEEHGIIVQDFLVSSIPILPTYTEIEGSDRLIDGGAVYGQRTINVPFQLKAQSLSDFPRIRDLLFSLVQSKESFYIRELRRQKALSYAFVDTTQPAMMDHESNNRYANGKQYRVRLQGNFNIEQIQKDGEGELVFETTELPFAESIGATADIQANGLTDERFWSDGMGLDGLETTPAYVSTSSAFRVYNAGSQSIHPYEQKLRITIDNLTAGSWFELENLTTGDVFRVNENASGKTIVLNGPNITANGLQYYPTTNRRFITLAAGWNDFVIRNTTGRRVSFDFVFYYD